MEFSKFLLRIPACKEALTANTKSKPRWQHHPGKTEPSREVHEDELRLKFQTKNYNAMLEEILREFFVYME